MKYDSLLDMVSAFPDEQSCIEHLEQLRWPTGMVCPLCGGTRKIYKINRPGRYKCSSCQKQFGIRKGTIYEESPIPLKKWFAAAWLITSNRKGISSHQLAREIGVTQKTAWFVLGRLREAAANATKTIGPTDGPFEVDETYLGGKEKNKHTNKKLHAGRGAVGKDAAVGIRSRSGKVTAKKTGKVNKKNLNAFIQANVPSGNTVYTDDHKGYSDVKKQYTHEVVVHSVGEYVRGMAHTNGIESFWALLKRGYHGTFHYFTWRHLDRYLSEFSFRWNLIGLAGGQRMDAILTHGFSSRLAYKDLIR